MKKARKGQIPEGDRTVGELSSDGGDHVVYEVPTSAAKTVERLMRDAGVERDRDEDLLSRDPRVAQRMVGSRDSQQLRYRQARVVDPSEDREPEVDDDSVVESDEVSAES